MVAVQPSPGRPAAAAAAGGDARAGWGTCCWVAVPYIWQRPHKWVLGGVQGPPCTAEGQSSGVWREAWPGVSCAPKTSPLPLRATDEVAAAAGEAEVVCASVGLGGDAADCPPTCGCLSSDSDNSRAPGGSHPPPSYVVTQSSWRGTRPQPSTSSLSLVASAGPSPPCILSPGKAG